MGKEEEIVDHPSLFARDSTAITGWDPYEVWRTRVLLPRLANERRHHRPPTETVKKLYVVSPPSLTNDGAALEGWWEPGGELDKNDDALKRELINVTGCVLIMGLASAFLSYDNREAR